MSKRYEIIAYNYPDGEDYAERCSDDAQGVEFDLVEFDGEDDNIGESVSVFATRREAEKWLEDDLGVKVTP